MSWLAFLKKDRDEGFSINGPSSWAESVSTYATGNTQEAKIPAIVFLLGITILAVGIILAVGAAAKGDFIKITQFEPNRYSRALTDSGKVLLTSVFVISTALGVVGGVGGYLYGRRKGRKLIEATGATELSSSYKTCAILGGLFVAFAVVTIVGVVIGSKEGFVNIHEHLKWRWQPGRAKGAWVIWDVSHTWTFSDAGITTLVGGFGGLGAMIAGATYGGYRFGVKKSLQRAAEAREQPAKVVSSADASLDPEL